MLAIADKLQTGDPYLYHEIKNSYERSARLALEHFKADNPKLTVDPKLVFFLEDKPIDVIFEKIEKSKALAVVGFKRTPSAKAALPLANKHKIMMLSPVSPLDEVIASPYSRGPAFSVSKTKIVLADFSKSFRNKFVVVKPDAPLANSHEIPSDFIVIDDLEKESVKKMIPDGSLLFFPSYVYDYLGSIKKFLNGGKRVTLIGSTPWSYSEALLRRYELNCEIYSISQFFDRTTSTLELNNDSIIKEKAHRFVRDYYKLFKEIPESSAHSFYDCMMLALTTIYLEGGLTRELFRSKMDNIEFKGITGLISFKNGKSDRSGYLVKWAKDHFEPVKIYRL